MLRDAFFKGLRDQRRALLFWSLALAAYALSMCFLFPSIRESAVDMQGYIESMPEAFRSAFMGESTDFSRADTFLNAELFSFMSPILLLVFAIGLAAAQVAGEEESGSLSLLLAYPVSRRKLLAQKLGVLLVGIAALTAVHLGALVVGELAVDMGLAAGQLVDGHVNLGLLVAAVAAVAFAAGAATGRRSVAITAGAGLAAVSYLMNVIAPLVERLEPLRYASLFYYYGGAEPLRVGLRPAYLAVLLGVTAAAALVAFVAFERRDVRV